MLTRPFVAAALLLVATLGGCPDPKDPTPETGTWSQVALELPAAVLSVTGTSASDVWAVGADKGTGPQVLHYDGTAWKAVATGTRGSLWWAQAFANGPVFFAGANSTVLRYDGTTFTRMPTPGVARYTVFGLWGASPTDLYAVGSLAGRNGFVWHSDGTTWTDVTLPDLPELPRSATGTTGDVPGLFKVWGDGNGTVWVVGSRGLVLKKSAGGEFEVVPTTTQETLFTVAGRGDDLAIVGGGTASVLLNGSELTPVAASDVVLLQAVAFGADGEAYAAGERGIIYQRNGKAWAPVTTGLAAATYQSLHALWVDPEGGVWAVGGNVLTASLDKGAIVHYGADIPTYVAPAPPVPDTTCPLADIDPTPTGSIARRWNEQVLDAIRRDLPRPGVHARNLFHLSEAMWDAWAAYDPNATAVRTQELGTADAAGLAAARTEAISYAAYRVLAHRYSQTLAVGFATSQDCFTKFMGVLGYDPSDDTRTGNSPRAIGNRIAAALIEACLDDGCNESENYEDMTGYMSVNKPLAVEQPGVSIVDPNIWQPIDLAEAETQNGIPTGAGAQGYICSNWDLLVPFALTRADVSTPYYDPGPTPTFGTAELRDMVVDVIEKESVLDPTLPATIDLSPGAYGNNSLGTNDGRGHPVNPVTGQPYPANVVKLGDFGRTLAEFWADGPRSETPPGHWNVLANEVGDELGQHRMGGDGPELTRLEWDLRLYLAINGAVHDAAIVSWGLKRTTLGPRPLSLVRYMGQLGQSSDAALPSYDPNGLPIVPGMIELITEESSASGQRHEHLARYVGEIAVRGWRGEPGDRANEIGGVAWLRAVEWIPYQRRTFVTPAFPGFVSGHSTFSRAAAEVLTLFTGSEYFPGGLGEFVGKAHSHLIFEDGPSTDVHLQWATYYDAADQAGQSRVYGSIHLNGDDFAGRKVGSETGIGAYEKALTYFPNAE